MSSKVIIPIAVAISVIVTAGIMYAMNFFNNLEEINTIKLENTGKFIEYLEEEILR